MNEITTAAFLDELEKIAEGMQKEAILGKAVAGLKSVGKRGWKGKLTAKSPAVRALGARTRRPLGYAGKVPQMRPWNPIRPVGP